MDKKIPLAHKMRPQSLEEFLGQIHLVGENKPLRAIIESKDLPSSIILWGPPGCGKTTIAKIIAKSTNSEFVELSAVSASKDDIKAAMNRTRLMNKRVILFLDEIHRFNKAQQDFLLPFVENGTITLIGATTENPSFEVISPLLSRSRVFVLNQLSEEELKSIIYNTSKKSSININQEEISLIAQLANGDARSALNILELSSYLSPNNISKESILTAINKPTLRYDKSGEEHYNIISALHKSMRDSDPDASVYWTMRMIEAGEDPKYIIRRMIRFASEDIGNADPQALILAIAAKETVQFLGYPECNTALVQTAIYLSKAPKNNSVYQAVNLAKAEIENSGNLPVPLHLRNAPTQLMKELEYGKGYKYAHDYQDAKVDQQHLPDRIKDKKFYYQKDK
ncbi:MAG: replication-associated recombination protein A [Nanoarchaeota archaeon]